eukprot:756080-Hanusia_phi.AAC.2
MSRSASSDIDEQISGRTGQSLPAEVAVSESSMPQGVGMHMTRRSDGSFFVRDLVANGSAAMSGQVQVRTLTCMLL